MSLSVEEMRKPVERKRQEVPVPEFGEGKTVWVYALSAGEMNLVNASIMNAKWEGVDRSKAVNRTHHILCFAIRDKNGNRLLTNDDDIKLVAEWPTELYDRILDVANELNGKAVQTKKNLDATEGE